MSGRLDKAGGTIARLASETAHLFRRCMIRVAFRKISLASDAIRFETDPAAIARLLTGHTDAEAASPASSLQAGQSKRKHRSRRKRAGSASDSAVPNHASHSILVPISIKRRGVESRLVIENGTAAARKPDQPLVDATARAHAYLDALTDGAGRDRMQVATLFGVHPEDVSRILPLAFLSPDLVDAILHGRQAADLSVRDLARGIHLPLSWVEQAALLSA